MGTPTPSAHAFVSPHLRELITAVREAATRVVASASPLVRATPAEDPDAVHDLRVALRRLRTILRPLGPLYGERRIRRIRRGLGRVADGAGQLRDEEVLFELVRELPLPPDEAPTITAWLTRRRPVERRLRREVVAQLREAEGPDALGVLLAALERRIAHLDAKDDTGITADSLAWTAMRRTVGDVAAGLDAPVEDGEAMHALRICEKRLRYTAELFTELLGEDGERLQKTATKMQRRLGDLHDVDFALERVQRARSLPEPARAALVAALQAARTRYAARVQELMLTHGAALWTVAAGG